METESYDLSEDDLLVASVTVRDLRTCPLKFIKACNWTGSKTNVTDMISHCLKEHSKNTFISDTQKFTVSNFNVQLIPRKYFILFCELGNIFRFTWDLDEITLCMRFGLYFLFDFGIDVEYVYEIDFLYGRKKIIKLRGPSFHLPDEETMFLDKNYFTLPYGLVKKYCDSEGNLVFTVKIICEGKNE